MAETSIMSRICSRPENVIDLTLDDENITSIVHAISNDPPRTTSPRRPSLAFQSLQSNLSLSEHGLKVIGTFATAESLGPPLELPNHSTLKRKRLFRKHGSPLQQARNRFIRRPKNGILSFHGQIRGQRELEHLNDRSRPSHFQPSLDNLAKRRRLNLEKPARYLQRGPIPFSDGYRPRCLGMLAPGANMTRTLSATSNGSSVSRGRYRAQLSAGPVLGEDDRSVGVGTTENLKDVFRHQVFPHINRNLERYRRHIDETTCKMIGKKTASELCDDEFMADLKHNKGRLSKSFEKQLSNQSRVLISKYVADSVDEHSTEKPKGKDQLLRCISERNERSSRRTKDASTFRQQSDDMRNSKSTQKPVIISLDSSSSSDEDETSTTRSSASLDLSIVNDHQKKYSSSPTTSISEYRDKHAFDTDSDDDVRPSILGSEMSPGPVPIISWPSTCSTMHPPRSQRRKAKSLPQNLSSKATRAIQSRSKLVSTAVSAAQSRDTLRLSALDSSISRPYLSAQARKDIAGGLSVLYSQKSSDDTWSEDDLTALQEQIIHVDFTQEETEYMRLVIESVLDQPHGSGQIDSIDQINTLMAGRDSIIPKTIMRVKVQDPGINDQGKRLVLSRQSADITGFLQDAVTGSLSKQRELKRLKPRSLSSQRSRPSAAIIGSALRSRELWGTRPCRYDRDAMSLKNTFMHALEDSMHRDVEWSDCSGDIACITWIPGGRFVCGAITHSDSHNQQYNKPGNLMVGSINSGILQSISGHRIARPVVSDGENSQSSMRETQDPWLYSSVTSTTYCQDYQKCFTGSFDGTVKAWDVTADGSSMELSICWMHDGNVNFVISSSHHDKIATAADVPQDAIRVYKIKDKGVSAAAYDVYSGEKADEQSLQRRKWGDTWAYYPATISWGKAPSVASLLLAGYSPRSDYCYDYDIPDDKRNTGELCLWDTDTGHRLSITSARTSNVFEVIWHPSQPIFVAATSPSGVFEDGVRTQIRLFTQTDTGTFSHTKTLDCPALDINEITVMPNSTLQCYVTASCTDGKTYVWDTAQNDEPIHILSHGSSIDAQAHDMSLEECDAGVKFAAWGQTLDRFYTGSSDGVLKSWNIRMPRGQEFVQDIIVLSGGICTGSFSPDFTRLLIGDSTGKVHLMRLDGLCMDGETTEATLRKTITPHHPPPPPLAFLNDEEVPLTIEPTAIQLAQSFINKGQIKIHPDEYVGAVQGDNYASTGLFCPRLHEDGEPGNRVLSWWDAKQRERYRRGNIGIPRLPQLLESSSIHLHEENCLQDLRLEDLSPETLQELEQDRVDFDFREDHEFTLDRGVKSKGTEVEEGDCEDDHEPMSDLENSEFQKLGQDLYQELQIQRHLDMILKDLSLDES